MSSWHTRQTTKVLRRRAAIRVTHSGWCFFPLGWAPRDVEVIDRDLGLSGTSAARRQGFRELMSRVCLGEVGAVLGWRSALAAAPHDFTVAGLTAKVRGMSGQSGYTSRQAAYDLRKLRSKGLAVKPARTRRYRIPPSAARTIAALRDHVIAPVIAGAQSPPRTQTAHWTAIDRDYETLRIGMQALFHDLGIATPAAAAA